MVNKIDKYVYMYKDTVRKSENAPVVWLLVHIDTVNLIRKYLLNEVHQNVNATLVQSIISSIHRSLGTVGPIDCIERHKLS